MQPGGCLGAYCTCKYASDDGHRNYFLGGLGRWGRPEPPGFPGSRGEWRTGSMHGRQRQMERVPVGTNVCDLT